MARKIFLLVLSLTMLITQTACDKWLDLKPQDGIVQQEFWKNKEQVESAVAGCYASLIDGLPEKVFLLGEIRADMMDGTFRLSNNELEIINTNILATNGLTDWRDFYRVINNCNTVIDFAPAVLQRDPTYSEAAMKAHVAEAKALRAWMYFYLVRLWGDVPLKLLATSSDEDIEPIAKSPQSTVLAQIALDLQQAEQDALTSYGSQRLDHGRVTRYMINALQADVYLWMEKPEDALAACNKVIASARFGLLSAPERSNAWFYTIKAGNSTEGIFELAYGSDYMSARQFGVSNFPLYALFGSGTSAAFRKYNASAYVTEVVFTEDITDVSNYDTRADEASLRTTTGEILKYNRSTGDAAFNYIVYRYADVLLMKAEALALLNRGAEALAIVQQIRTRAWAIPQTEKTPDVENTTGKDGVLDYILEERAREFAFEGKRWFDVVRHAKRNNYQRLDLMIELTVRSVAGELQQSAIAKIRDVNSHYLPVFQYEINTNRLLEQNPFYK